MCLLAFAKGKEKSNEFSSLDASTVPVARCPAAVPPSVDGNASLCTTGEATAEDSRPLLPVEGVPAYAAVVTRRAHPLQTSGLAKPTTNVSHISKAAGACFPKTCQGFWTACQLASIWPVMMSLQHINELTIGQFLLQGSLTTVLSGMVRALFPSSLSAQIK